MYAISNSPFVCIHIRFRQISSCYRAHKLHAASKTVQPMMSDSWMIDSNELVLFNQALKKYSWNINIACQLGLCN